MFTFSARCRFYKHDEMQIKAVTYNQLQQETSESYVRKVLLPPYVSGALNESRICVQLLVLVTSEKCDEVLLAEGESVFISPLWMNISEQEEKLGTDSFMAPREGSLQREVYSAFETNSCGAKH